MNQPPYGYINQPTASILVDGPEVALALGSEDQGEFTVIGRPPDDPTIRPESLLAHRAATARALCAEAQSEPTPEDQEDPPPEFYEEPSPDLQEEPAPEVQEPTPQQVCAEDQEESPPQPLRVTRRRRILSDYTTHPIAEIPPPPSSRHESQASSSQHRFPIDGYDKLRQIYASSLHLMPSQPLKPLQTNVLRKRSLKTRSTQSDKPRQSLLSKTFARIRSSGNFSSSHTAREAPANTKSAQSQASSSVTFPGAHRESLSVASNSSNVPRMSYTSGETPPFRYSLINEPTPSILFQRAEAERTLSLDPFPILPNIATLQIETATFTILNTNLQYSTTIWVFIKASSVAANAMRRKPNAKEPFPINPGFLAMINIEVKLPKSLELLSQIGLTHCPALEVGEACGLILRLGVKESGLLCRRTNAARCKENIAPDTEGLIDKFINALSMNRADKRTHQVIDMTINYQHSLLGSSTNLQTYAQVVTKMIADDQVCEAQYRDVHHVPRSIGRRYSDGSIEEDAIIASTIVAALSSASAGHAAAAIDALELFTDFHASQGSRVLDRDAAEALRKAEQRWLTFFGR